MDDISLEIKVEPYAGGFLSWVDGVEVNCFWSASEEGAIDGASNYFYFMFGIRGGLYERSIN